jgi:two-component system, NarL family, nitrate/nitrite response regulator NarL
MLTRIAIAERQQLFREALRSLLESQADFSVVVETGDGNHLPNLVAKHKPDILLLDQKLLNCSGLDVLRNFPEQLRGVRSILLTESISQAEIIQFLLAGVRGVMTRNSPTELLFKSIRTVMEGQHWLTRDLIDEVVKNLRSFANKVEEKSAQLQTRSLSPQQLQIVQAIVAGCSNKDIALDLAVSERTVKYHLTRIFNKFGVAGRIELARYSLENDVVREA